MGMLPTEDFQVQSSRPRLYLCSACVRSTLRYYGLAVMSSPSGVFAWVGALPGAPDGTFQAAPDARNKTASDQDSLLLKPANQATFQHVVSSL